MIATGTGLMWTEAEIPMGADVHLYIGGNDEPEMIDDKPIVWRPMTGGIPNRRKIYHIQGNRVVAGLRGFREDALFSPVSVYNPSDAPADANYAVFEEGQRKIDTFPSGDTKPYRAAKGFDGGVFISHQFPFRSYYPLGIPVLDCKLRRLTQYSYDELVEAIKKYGDDIGRFRKMEEDPRFHVDSVQFASEIEHMQNKRMEMMEVLARTHRHSVGELILAMKDIDCEYLVDAQLDEDAQLVPIQ
jgi:hypothetical protein